MTQAYTDRNQPDRHLFDFGCVLNISFVNSCWLLECRCDCGIPPDSADIPVALALFLATSPVPAPGPSESRIWSCMTVWILSSLLLRSSMMSLCLATIRSSSSIRSSRCRIIFWNSAVLPILLLWWNAEDTKSQIQGVTSSVRILLFDCGSP